MERQCHAVLNAQREAAMEAFKSLGFPSRKVERYRYTDVAEAFAPDYGLSMSPYTIKSVDYVSPISEAPIDVAPYYNKIADASDGLTALNTALAHDALVVYIPKGTVCKNPIRIENILSGAQDTMIVRRILIIMEESSEATIFFVDHAKQAAMRAKHLRARTLRLRNTSPCRSWRCSARTMRTLTCMRWRRQTAVAAASATCT